MITLRANRPLNAPAQQLHTLPRTALMIGVENSVTSHLALALRDAGVAVTVQAIMPETILSARKEFSVIEQPIADVRFAEQLEALQPEVVVFAPAEPQNVGSSFYPTAVFNRVVERTATLCESLRRHAPDTRLLLLSSADVYGECAVPQAESVTPAPTTLAARYAYMAEQVARDFSAAHKLRVTIARVASVYGPAIRNNPVYDLCFNLLGPQGVGTMMAVNLDAQRDLLHVADFAEAVKLVLTRKEETVYNIGAGHSISLRELQTQICDLLELSNRSTESATTGHQPAQQRLDTTKLEQLGFRPSVPLLEGLRGYISWWSGIKAA